MRNPTETALHFLDTGFSVMPVDGVSKVPLLVSWKEYQTRRATREEVENWWKKWPEADFGIITGKISGITVVDTEKDADIKLFGLKGTETPTVRTGGGGFHFYFKYRPGLNNSIKFAPFHDLKTDGGYVIAPPSKHKSGNNYAWEIPYGAVMFADLPQSIEMALSQKEKKVAVILNTISGEGSRNTNAASVAGKLLSRLPEREWGTEAWPLLQSWNSTKAQPPLSEEELLTTFKSIAETEKRRRVKGNVADIQIVEEGDNIIATLPIDDSFAIFEFSDFSFDARTQECALICHIEKPEGKTRMLSARLNLFSLSARESFLRQFKESFELEKKSQWPAVLSEIFARVIKVRAAAYKETRWMDIKVQEFGYYLFPFIVKDAPNALFGKGGTGKTFLTQRIALSVAFGFPFAQHYIPAQTTNVLFLDFEDDAGEFKDRLTRLIKGLPPEYAKPTDEEIHNRVVYFDSKGMPLANLLQPLRDAVTRNNIGLLIIDSAAKACGGNVEDSDTTNKFFNTLKSLGITSLVIAHESKNALTNNDFIFGSSYWNYSFRNVWKTKLDREQGEDVIHAGLIHCKTNRGRLHTTRAFRMYFGQDFTEIHSEDPTKSFLGDTSLKTQILATLKEQSMTVPQIAEQLDENQNTIRTRLHELAKKNIVQQTEGSLWTLKKDDEIDF